MRFLKNFLLITLTLAWAAPASAGPILDRVKARGALRCGGVERPGMIDIEADAKAGGLELDICRAIASVILGPEGKLEFTRYDSEKAFAAVRDGHDDVSFLTGMEIVKNGLAGKIIPGPAIFIETTSIMVPEDSSIQHVADLAGQPICFWIGAPDHQHLEAWFAARHLSFIRKAFSEEGEMNDGYTVRYCKGVVGEVTKLADTRTAGATSLAKHRILSEPLAAFPILATTSVSDGEFAAIVAWTIHTLVRADAPGNDWALGGVDSLRLHAPELGLRDGWQKQLIETVGSYGDIYERDLGAKSSLNLPRGLNANLADGGVFASPDAD